MRVQYKLPNEPTSATQFCRSAWNECSELQVRPYLEFCTSLKQSIESIDRIEVIESGVGGMIISDSNDMHVGPCLTAMWVYVHPKYRNSGWYRKFLRSLKDACTDTGISNYMFTHRTGHGRYENIYRSVSWEAQLRK